MLRVSAAQMSERDTLFLKFALGDLQRFAGDEVKARATLVQVRDGMTAMLKTQPENAWQTYGRLAQVLACLGDTKEANVAADRAVELLPVSIDALSGANMVTLRVQVWARNGDRDRAIPELKRLLTVPGARLTPAILRLDAVFDKLRGDPRFEALLK